MPLGSMNPDLWIFPAGDKAGVVFLTDRARDAVSQVFNLAQGDITEDKMVLFLDEQAYNAMLGALPSKLNILLDQTQEKDFS